MQDFHIPLVPDHVYHVSNRAVGNEKIFIEERNYDFFLKKALKHISPIAEIFSYSLVPNHFHLIIKIKNIEVIKDYYTEIKKGKTMEIDRLCDFVMERLSNYLNSYTKAFNKTYERKGALFIDYLKREEIEGLLQFLEAVVYIHQDPLRHGHCKTMKDWYWNSYNHDFFNQRATLLSRFGGEEKFELMHRQPMGRSRYQMLEIA